MRPAGHHRGTLGAQLVLPRAEPPGDFAYERNTASLLRGRLAGALGCSLARLERGARRVGTHDRVGLAVARAVRHDDGLAVALRTELLERDDVLSGRHYQVEWLVRRNASATRTSEPVRQCIRNPAVRSAGDSRRRDAALSQELCRSG